MVPYWYRCLVLVLICKVKFTMAVPFQAFCIAVTPYQQNCTLLWDGARDGAVIDPGGDVDKIKAAIAEQSVTVEKIFLTHGHLDHASGATQLARELGGIPIIGPHQDDQFLLDALEGNRGRPGFQTAEVCKPDQWLGDGDTVSFGTVSFSVLHCPGHTPGHVVYFHPEARLAFVGDVLFRGSIGRTDFPRGDHAQLLSSIRNKLLPLGDDVEFVPGHGPMSRFGTERLNNPFLADTGY